jgi:hypothetical protein
MHRQQPNQCFTTLERTLTITRDKRIEAGASLGAPICLEARTRSSRLKLIHRQIRQIEFCSSRGKISWADSALIFGWSGNSAFLLRRIAIAHVSADLN